MLKTVAYIILAITLLKHSSVRGQSHPFREEGIPYARYFSPKEYKANPQNWSVLQKENGTMVFGNGDAVMTFDGSRWQLIPMTNNNLVRSLAFGPDQKLYAGGYNEIGYVEEVKLGTPRFVSLTSKLEDDEREFGHVWNIFVHDKKIYFATDKNILVWSNDQLSVIKVPFEDTRIFSTVYEDKILIQPAAENLAVLEGDQLKALPGGEFYRGKRITSILPFANNVALVCTIDEGMFLYDGVRSTPFQSEATPFLKENRLYKGIRLNDGNYALGTLNRGVIILDKNGSVIRLLEKGRGLGDNAVYNLAQDRQGALWVTMSVGLSRVELHTPMTWFDERNGLAGAVNDIVRFENNLYAATMLGFYKLKPGSSFEAPARFEKVGAISSSVWGMTVRQGSLLLATDQGTVELKNGNYKFLDDYSGAVVFAAMHNPSIIYVGLTDGVIVLEFRNGQWKSIGRMEGVEADVGEMNEDRDGNLWLGTFSEGAVRLEFSQQNGQRDYLHPTVTRFGEANGLPLGYVQVNRVRDELFFRVEPDYTAYQFDPDKKAFTPYNFNASSPENDSISVYPFANEQRGKLWMISRRKEKPSFDFLLLASTTGNADKEFISFSRVREDVDEAIFMDNDDIAWLGGLDGIVRFKYRSIPERNSQFNVVLNEIKLKDDSILFSGTGNPLGDVVLSYAYNTVDFSFGATGYDLHDENEYQYILEGFDDDWSPWTKETSKSYTRVFEDDYVFKVRARNIYGEISPETHFAFAISPPWYRHTVAYIAYTLLFAAMVYTIVRARSRKLEREKEALEKIIEERTTEISNKNIQLEQQAEELKAQTEQLKEMDKIKSNFFTNISHEFRTPLSLILAPLEKELAENAKRPETEMMYRNARRLQNLINQLLDLSKVESGQMKVFLCRNDLTSFIKVLLSSFHSLAESKDIRFTQSIPDTAIDAYFDADKLETILYNLLSNAFKFTPEGGNVTLAMNISSDHETCEFVVTDTGAGIPESEIPKIFDRFYQVDGGVQREFEGSGIGLALTRELVLLMQGNISVESKLHEGTTFRLTLPIYKGENATVPEEIAFDFKSLRQAPAEDLDSYVKEEATPRDRATLLLVEDNKDLSAYLSGILEKTYQVLVTFNGEEALTVAQDVIPDLILSDMMMPKMDGFTLCEEIRKNEATSHISFILLTARASVESRLAGLELGADDYMTKPFNVAELQLRIKNLLQQREKLKKRYRHELKLEPKEMTVTSTDEKFLLKVMEVVESRMADVTFSVEQLSEAVGMSRKNLHRKMVALVDQPPNEFIRVFRLKNARQLLEQQSGSVKEVAFSVGFNNLSYFAKCFKEQFGISPTDIAVKKKISADEI